jgi:lipopolysaccharide export system permease protein
MRLLDRYLLRELLIPLSYCLMGFLIFWISWDLLSEISEFQSRKLKGFDVLQYYFVKTPEALAWPVLPVALLLALLYALTNHARYNELTAIRGAGVSLWRLSLPYFGLAFALSLVLLAINEFWVPRSTAKAEQILTRYQPVTLESGAGVQRTFNFRYETGGRSWRVESYHPQAHLMQKINLQWDHPDGSWEDIFADSAAWATNGWAFANVQVLKYSSRQQPVPIKEIHAAKHFQFAETPELIESEIRINNLSSFQASKRLQLSIQEIVEYLRLHPKIAPARAALLNTQLHGRMAAPWTCLVVVLIALPFGAPTGRRNVFVGVAASIFICFIYFIVHRLGLALGTGGFLPGWLAAWLPNVLFATGGAVLTSRVR